VELRHLRYFVAVAEELHFAGRRYLAQPAVSEHVRKLEEEAPSGACDRLPRSEPVVEGLGVEKWPRLGDRG
jgi:DNA-binding transcriptional LysR family regulator